MVALPEPADHPPVCRLHAALVVGELREILLEGLAHAFAEAAARLEHDLGGPERSGRTGGGFLQRGETGVPKLEPTVPCQATGPTQVPTGESRREERTVRGN